MTESTDYNVSFITDLVERKVCAQVYGQNNPQSQFLIKLSFKSFDEIHGGNDTPLMSLILVLGVSENFGCMSEQFSKTKLYNMLKSNGIAQQIRHVIEHLEQSFENVSITVTVSKILSDPNKTDFEGEPEDISIHLGLQK